MSIVAEAQLGFKEAVTSVQTREQSLLKPMHLCQSLKQDA